MSSTRNSAAAQGPPEIPPPVPVLPGGEEPDAGRLDRDVADRLLQQRIVLASGPLDDALANQITAQLLLLGRRVAKPMELHLSCPRSELDASLRLADTLDVLAAPVHVLVRGSLIGPAVAVLCAGRSRSAHRHTTILLAVPRTSASGTSAELVARAEEQERQVTRLQARIVEATGQPAHRVRADLESGRVLDAAQARDYGLLDELL